MKKEVKQGLIGLLAGTALLFNSGCDSSGQKDFFNAKLGATEKRIAALPPSFYLWPVHGGQYNFKKIIDPKNNETIGYDISYHRWTEAVGVKLKDEYQQIKIPGAKNMSIKQDFFLKDRFDITYELNGQKRLDKYHLGFAGDQCKLAEQHVLDKEKKEYVRLK